jgi:hypothetical protein
VGADLVFALALGLLAAAGLGRAMRTAARRGGAWQDRVTERWGRIAEDLGGELSVSGEGALAPRKLTLSSPHEESVAVAQTTVPAEPSGLSHTRAAATFVLGSGPRFEMRERAMGGGPSLERTVLEGHEELIRRVRLTAEEPERARAVWTEEARHRAAKFRRPLALHSDGTLVELVWDGVELDAEVLRTALALVGELSLAGVDVLRGLAALEGAHYEPRKGALGPVVRVTRGPGEVQLLARPASAGPVFEARAEPRRPLPAFEARVGADGTVEGDVPQGVIDPAVAADLARVGASTLRGEGDRLVLRWDEPPDVARGEAAVRLLATVAKGTGSQGAFR